MFQLASFTSVKLLRNQRLKIAKRKLVIIKSIFKVVCCVSIDYLQQVINAVPGWIFFLRQ